MCKTVSCILTNDYKVLMVPGSDKHEDIVEKYKLKDDKIKSDRTWLKVEIHPKNSLNSTNPDDWEFCLDGETPYPDWYNYDLANNECKKHLFTEIKNGRYNGFWSGSLDLRDTQITKLPDNLNVGGTLYLQGTQITELPDNLNVGGDLDLQGTQITELPDNLNVGGDIFKDF